MESSTIMIDQDIALALNNCVKLFNDSLSRHGLIPGCNDCHAFVSHFLLLAFRINLHETFGGEPLSISNSDIRLQSRLTSRKIREFIKSHPNLTAVENKKLAKTGDIFIGKRKYIGIVQAGYVLSIDHINCKLTRRPITEDGLLLRFNYV